MEVQGIEVGIINESGYPLPEYQTLGSSGLDVRANIERPVLLKPLGRIIIPTGLYLEIPEGYEIQVRSRSGLTIKRGLVVANGIGTIDSDYRDELGIILLNISDEDQIIEPGDRIAQIVLVKYEKLEWKIKEKLSETDRNLGGFGHTGTK